MRPTARLRLKLDRAIQHAREPLYNRQAESQPARNLRALVETMEFDEYVAPSRLRDADAGVVNIDTQTIAAPPAADQHAPFWRVFNGIGNEVLDQPPQQPAIGPYDLPAWHEGEVQPFGSGKRSEFEFDLTDQLVDSETGELGAQ